MTLDSKIIIRIHHLHSFGFSIREIAKHTAVSRDSVSKYINTPYPSFTPRKQRYSILTPYLGHIIYYLCEDPQISSTIIHNRLVKCGFKGEKSIIVNHLKDKRQEFQLMIDLNNYPSPLGKHMQEQLQEIGYLWIFNLLQGKISKKELEKKFVGKLTVEDINALYFSIINQPLKYRNRALTILLYYGDVSQRRIAEFLSVDRGTVASNIDIFKNNGVDGLFSKTRKKIKKYEEKEYTDALFEILHSPPSLYDLNRTSWSMDTLYQIMGKTGHKLSKDGIRKIIKNEGYKFCKARKKLTSNDPCFREKLKKITGILENLKKDEKFFSVDEFGPVAIKVHGGRTLVGPGEVKTIPQIQKSKGSLICTAALELSTNQITHFYSKKKNTQEILKLLDILLDKYSNETCIYVSWDAASWHVSKDLYVRVEEINSSKFSKGRKIPKVELAPLPSRAQFLNVIESVFSGLSKAIIHNSNYNSVDHCISAIDRYFEERNQYFLIHPKKAGNKIWGKEKVVPQFSKSNNCKDLHFR